jgi:predicted transcriptional regulator of viral defense system
VGPGKGRVCLETALAVHNLGEANPAAVHLTVPDNFRSRGALDKGRTAYQTPMVFGRHDG